MQMGTAIWGVAKNMKKSAEKEILLKLTNIERTLNEENRHDRLKSFERALEIVRGNQEETDRRLKAMEQYLKVEYYKGAKYMKKRSLEVFLTEEEYKKVKAEVIKVFE